MNGCQETASVVRTDDCVMILVLGANRIVMNVLTSIGTDTFHPEPRACFAGRPLKMTNGSERG
jgi:hypothetical protein